MAPLASQSVAGALVSAVLLVGLANADPSTLRLGGTDGNVVAFTRVGNTLYVGGFFSHAGPVTGSCVALNTETGARTDGVPEFRGPVHSIVPDRQGGWFVAGAFDAIDGVPHGPIAHLDAEFHAKAWDPNPNGEVLAMTMKGDTLIVGGEFTEIGGQPRPFLAAFLASGDPVADTLPSPNERVRALLIEGTQLFVGGEFNRIGGVERTALAAIDLETLNVDSWNAGLGVPTAYASVQALVTLGNALVIGGLWVEPDLSLRCLAAADLRTGQGTGWTPSVTGPADDVFLAPHVDALTVADTSIVVGGHFTQIGGFSRIGLGKIGYPSGIISDWNPSIQPKQVDVGEEVSALLARGSTLYVAGLFEAVGDSTRASLASVDIGSGDVLPWDVGTSFRANALALTEEVILVGGDFVGAGREWGTRHESLAAFDLATGSVKSWNPRMSGLGVQAMAAGNGSIYVGGYFDQIGGQPRYCLAALDTLEGNATEWNPDVDGPVFALRTVADSLYIGGAFTRCSGQARSRVCVIETSSGTLLSWAPSASDAVRAIEPVERAIYLGGDFLEVNGVWRPGVVAVNSATGELEPFDCGLSIGGVACLAATGDTLYVGGGGFLSIGGQPRIGLAALDAHTGRALDWRADAPPFVTALARVDSLLLVGGAFETIGGVQRTGLAAVSVKSADVGYWNPQLNSTVWGVATFDHTVVVGGSFTEAFGRVTGHLLGLSIDETPPTIPRRLTLLPLWPNPASEAASVEFTIPDPGTVSLEVFDVQGRIAASPLMHQAFPAGRHQRTIPLGGLRKGFYVCRLTVGHDSAMRKFMVIR